MKPRSFNTIEVDTVRGIVRKSSTNPEKLEAEILFYVNAPTYMKRLLPKLHEYSETFSWYEMENIEYKTVTEIVTQRELSAEQWTRLFSLLGELLSECKGKYGRSDFTNLYQILIHKAIERARKTDNVELRNIFFVGSVINGKKMRGLADLLIENSGVLFRVDKKISVLHGDLCFSNILVNDEITDMRLIDPRGGFDSSSIYGPAIYDVAKMAQSVYSWYDKIIEGQYQLERAGSEYLLTAQGANWSSAASSAFSLILNSVDISKESAIALSGLMLAGTPTLHLDDSERAVALALNAVLILSGDMG
jgi:hypothetical protein